MRFQKFYGLTMKYEITLNTTTHIPNVLDPVFNVINRKKIHNYRFFHVINKKDSPTYLPFVLTSPFIRHLRVVKLSLLLVLSPPKIPICTYQTILKDMFLNGTGELYLLHHEKEIWLLILNNNSLKTPNLLKNCCEKILLRNVNVFIGPLIWFIQLSL